MYHTADKHCTIQVILFELYCFEPVVYINSILVIFGYMICINKYWVFNYLLLKTTLIDSQSRIQLFTL